MADTPRLETSRRWHVHAIIGAARHINNFEATHRIADAVRGQKGLLNSVSTNALRAVGSIGTYANDDHSVLH